MPISSVSNSWRPGVCTSTTRPTAPFDGQVIYETDTDRTLVWNNSAWVDVSTGKSGRAGLVKIDSFDVSATTTPFINGCFTSDFANYRILFSLYGSGAQPVRLRVRSGTSTPETGAVYDRTGFSWQTSMTSANSLNEVSFFLNFLDTSSATPLTGTIDIFNPNVANVYTSMISNSFRQTNGTINFHYLRIETNTQYTGFELNADFTATITGQATVYGYN